MRVGLVGVAGVGKTALAREVVRRKVVESNHDVPHTIDEYANDLADDLGADAVVGPESRYVVNLIVAAERERQEQAFRVRCLDTISCGTIIDTMAYEAANVLALQPLAQSSDQFRERFAKEFSALQILTLMSTDVLLYDQIFYLPVPKSAALEIPGQPPKFSDALIGVDEQIQQAVAHLNIPVNPLEDTFEKNVERVLACFSPSS